MASLRSSLELGLLSVYWNLSDDGHLVIKRWLHSRQDTPRPKEIWERLAAHEGIATFSHALDVRSRIQTLFGELSNYVHSRGRLYSNDHFEPEQPFISCRPSAGMIQLWAQTYREVVWLILALHLAKYPIGAVRGDWNDKFGIDVRKAWPLCLMRLGSVRAVVRRSSVRWRSRRRSGTKRPIWRLRRWACLGARYTF